MVRAVRHRAWILAVAPLLLVACNGPHARVACDDVGASMAVQIDYANVLRLHPKALTVRACVENDCTMQIIPSGQNRLSTVTLGQGALHAGHAAGVTLAITDDAGHDVFAGDVGVMPDNGQPKDPDCASAWIGQVVATGSHTLKESATG
jgi:hypothetical protein